jgi:hypothetical protein
MGATVLCHLRIPMGFNVIPLCLKSGTEESPSRLEFCQRSQAARRRRGIAATASYHFTELFLG